ncbi:MAG: hypothetical protein JWL64_819 [Frankiales bacterium]|nr:hypothetical protein [Frankiales bacterium]
MSADPGPSPVPVPASGSDPALDDLDLTEPDAPLRSFAVLARLSGADATDPVAEVGRRLAAAGLHPTDLLPDGGSEVRVRFVEASLDGETAVRGLDAALREAGLPVDEVWLDHQLD